VITLALDASTYVGTVAVIRDSLVVAAAEAAMRGEREERLMPAVAATMREAGVAPGDLDQVVCGAGPGSFTSLRIAASIAKGLAFAHDLPLGAVSSLVLMVAALEPAPAAGRYLAVLDALRGEAYAQLISVSAEGTLAASEPGLVALDGVDAAARSAEARLVGAGRAIDGAPHARGVARLASAAIEPVDVGSWEPAYGRLAEAQVRWEAAHGRPLQSGAPPAGLA
jgi:tRNA threonylcarbamoyladenosine biosynthesis protein TsaB